MSDKRRIAGCSEFSAIAKKQVQMYCNTEGITSIVTIRLKPSNESGWDEPTF